MSAFYGLVIWCDDCDGPPFKTHNLAQGLTEASYAGWKDRQVSGLTRWRCPACAKAAAQEAEMETAARQS